MSKPTNLVVLRDKLAKARDRIGAQREKIIADHKLPRTFNRSAYLFTYRRVEQLGLAAIQARMDEIEDWLPIQLELGDEVAPDTKQRMQHWLRNEKAPQPDSDDFGNDFVHAMTRCAVRYGIESKEFDGLADTIACLFRDITCVISIIHCCSELIELDMELVVLGGSGKSLSNLPQLARNLAVLTEEKIRLVERERAKKKKAAKTKKPKLRLVKNDGEARP